MTIPDFQTITRPILELLADGQIRRTREVTAAIADQFDLSAEDRATMLPSGRQRHIDNRVGWALTHMSQAGLLERPQRAHVRISQAGRSVLAMHPDRVDMRVLNGFACYLQFRQRSRKRAHRPGQTNRRRRRRNRSRHRIWSPRLRPRIERRSRGSSCHERWA